MERVRQLLVRDNGLLVGFVGRCDDGSPDCWHASIERGEPIARFSTRREAARFLRVIRLERLLREALEYENLGLDVRRTAEQLQHLLETKR